MSHNNPSRRSVLGCGALAVVAATLPISSASAASVHGFVYHDRDDTGMRAPTDPGLPGVLVSNGIDVALTDSTGRWELPFRADTFVYAIKPTDWKARPQHNGLPNLGVRTGQRPGTSAVNFGLRPLSEPRRFDVALLADTQPQCVVELGYLRDGILPIVAQSGAAFAINHGDIVFDRPELYERYISLVSATGMPWHHCPGNHDMDRRSDGTGCFDTWKEIFGPTHYAFEYGGALFIMLNNVAPMQAGVSTSSFHDYRGQIGHDQLAFIRNLLSMVPREKLVVISMHIPLVGWEDASDPSGHTEDAAALLQLLSGRPNTLTLAGHTHTTEHHYLGQESGFSGPGLHHHHVLTAACGSWWSGPFDPAGQPISTSRDGTPKGIHMLEIDNGRYMTRYVPIGHAGHERAAIWLEGSSDGHLMEPTSATAPTPLRPNIMCSDVPAVRLAVNVFDGGPKTKVTCELTRVTFDARGQFVHSFELAQTDAVDACLASSFQRDRSFIKPWVAASRCSHLWSSALPRGLSSGTYRAKLDITDEYGQPFAAVYIFEIA